MSRENEPVYPGMTSTGLTIREHFAALAMQGILANVSHGQLAAQIPREQFIREVSEDAVAHADALIKELERG